MVLVTLCAGGAILVCNDNDGTAAALARFTIDEKSSRLCMSEANGLD